MEAVDESLQPPELVSITFKVAEPLAPKLTFTELVPAPDDIVPPVIVHLYVLPEFKVVAYVELVDAHTAVLPEIEGAGVVLSVKTVDPWVLVHPPTVAIT